jgi:hypothetical protein
VTLAVAATIEATQASRIKRYQWPFATRDTRKKKRARAAVEQRLPSCRAISDPERSLLGSRDAYGEISP